MSDESISSQMLSISLLRLIIRAGLISRGDALAILQEDYDAFVQDGVPTERLAAHKNAIQILGGLDPETGDDG